MEGKASERWCMLRCAGDSHDKAVNIDRIMLRFRPIAPKPVSGGSVSGNSRVDNKNLSISGWRPKRKYVRVCKSDSYRRKNKKSDEYGRKDEIVTLQLLPERADFEDSTRRSQSWCNNNPEYCAQKDKVVIHDNQEDPMRLMMKGREFSDMGGFDLSDQAVVESWVTVESVTGACMEGGGLGSEDVEILKNLEKDTCPGFISDALNKVKWVNEAYRKMVTKVMGENDGQSPEKGGVVMVVSLVMKEKLPCLFSWLTCKVRLQYTWREEKYSKIVPCDVWRMGCGGFAWRLDVEAALSLGR